MSEGWVKGRKEGGSDGVTERVWDGGGEEEREGGRE